MTLNISSINNNSNLLNTNEKNRNNKEFSIQNDPVVEGIQKNVKDPIDREEDLMLWDNLGKNFKLNNNTYEGFQEIKKSLVCFPPATAPGRVRRQYREYMQKLPKGARDQMQGILTFTYGECVRNKGVDSSDWKQVLNAMKNGIGTIGDLNTDFDFIRKCVNDFSQFDKETKEDESVRQILI
ncbi:MAG: hypothetical protein E7213_08440 [Clostridium sp.]|nr:hypothetical protein [Clostridium sp.]